MNRYNPIAARNRGRIAAWGQSGNIYQPPLRPAGRVCECGTKLSQYNPLNVCSVCERKAPETARSIEADDGPMPLGTLETLKAIEHLQPVKCGELCAAISKKPTAMKTLLPKLRKLGLIYNWNDTQNNHTKYAVTEKGEGYISQREHREDDGRKRCRDFRPGIIGLLKNGPMTTNALVSLYKIPKSTMKQQLKFMESEGLVRAEKTFINQRWNHRYHLTEDGLRYRQGESA